MRALTVALSVTVSGSLTVALSGSLGAALSVDRFRARNAPLADLERLRPMLFQARVYEATTLRGDELLPDHEPKRHEVAGAEPDQARQTVGVVRDDSQLPLGVEQLAVHGPFVQVPVSGCRNEVPREPGHHG